MSLQKDENILRKLSGMALIVALLALISPALGAFGLVSQIRPDKK